MDFVAVDMPNANRLTVRLMAAIAQEERELISKRTKDAPAAAKARGVKLGGKRNNQRIVDHKLGLAALSRASDEFAASVCPTISELRDSSLSLRQIVAELEKRGIRTMRGGAWTAPTVRNVLLRIGATGARLSLALTVKEHAPHLCSPGHRSY